MSGHDREARGEASRWFALAADDIRAAKLCLDARVPVLGVAAFHCQQAAEKLIKGLLVLAGGSFRKTHDLDELADLAAPKFPKFVAHLDACRPLTDWGSVFRYPPLDEAAAALPTAERIGAGINVLSRFQAAIKKSLR